MPDTPEERARIEFLSAGVHELRTPLSVLKGYSQVLKRRLLRGTADPALLIQGLETLERQSDRLAAIIDDFVDANRLQRGVLVLEMADVPLPPMVEEALAVARGLTADVPIEAILPADAITVHTDRARLTRILAHVLEAAMRFTPDQQPVTVAVSPAPASVVITVTSPSLHLPAEFVPIPLAPHLPPGADVPLRPSGGISIGLHVAFAILPHMSAALTLERPEVGPGQFQLTLPLAVNGARTGF